MAKWEMFWESYFPGTEKEFFNQQGLQPGGWQSQHQKGFVDLEAFFEDFQNYLERGGW